jgi:hypothetical protein
MRYISIILSGIIALVVLGGLMISASGQTTTFYDKNGNRQGSVSQEGSRNVERDKNGNRLGYSSQEGNQTVYRDKNGNRLGTAKTN